MFFIVTDEPILVTSNAAEKFADVSCNLVILLEALRNNAECPDDVEDTTIRPRPEVYTISPPIGMFAE